MYRVSLDDDAGDAEDGVLSRKTVSHGVAEQGRRCREWFSQIPCRHEDGHSGPHEYDAGHGLIIRFDGDQVTAVVVR